MFSKFNKKKYLFWGGKKQTIWHRFCYRAFVFNCLIQMTVAPYFAYSATTKSLNRKEVSLGRVRIRKCTNIHELHSWTLQNFLMQIYRQDILRTLELTTYILSNLSFSLLEPYRFRFHYFSWPSNSKTCHKISRNRKYLRTSNDFAKK